MASIKRASIRIGLFGAVLTCITPYARAQDGGLAVQQFAPAPGGDQNYTHVHGAATLGHLKPGFGLFLNYAHRPLELHYSATDESVDLLAGQTQADLWVALGIGRSFQLGLGIPLTLVQTAGESSVYEGNLASTLLGDIRLIPKLKLFGKSEGAAMALEGAVTLPTGDPENLQGDVSLTFEPKAVLEWRGERLRAGLNAGYLVRTAQGIYDLEVGNELTFGAGLAYGIRPDRLTLLAEAFGKKSMATQSGTGVGTMPLEMNLALRIQPSTAHAITLGAGPGLSDGYGTPTFRAFLGYSFSGSAPRDLDQDDDGILDATDRCPAEPEDVDRFQDGDGCPDPDNDADGIPDVTDGCRDEAEDKDGFQDGDGCPDPDNDGDRVPDTTDRCPTELEDIDRFQDEDGCPDPDNDGDGILDAVDRCPNEAEDTDTLADEDGCPETDFDKDGVLDVADRCPTKPETVNGLEDGDGCPEQDSDQDGIVDKLDKCPSKPETINGVEDEDGCPDKGESKVEMTSERINILDKVYFDTGKASIQDRSFNVLKQVAAVLKANPQVTLVRIDGHTDNVDTDEFNLELSQRRTEAVRQFLVDQGINSGRL